MNTSTVRKIQYVLKISRRARLMRLSIHPDGSVVVTAPPLFNQKRIEKFIENYTDWIEKKIRQVRKRTLIWGDKKEILRYKKQACVFVEERCAYFGKIYGVKPGRISIRAQKSRWGSCSRRGNLSFNYQIILLPRNLADQAIVHELCHLIEFNHSKKFWSLVEKAIPDYLANRRELKNISVHMR
ncbi:MAG: SprT family zinc-dependent metalloprotease [Patescibacteria group bacterium]